MVGGGGNVGATCAFVLAERNLGEVWLLDICEGVAKGKALDMSQGGQVLNYDGQVRGTSDYADIAGAEVVVVTSGKPRLPGMTREDLIKDNAAIIQQVAEGLREHCPDAVIVTVTNPLDLMTYHLWRVSGFPSERVVGQAGILDSARMTHFVAEAIGCSNEDVQAMVLGGHGDTMVPLPRYTTAGGIGIEQLLDAGTIAAICDRTANGGGEIVKLLERGSAFYAPGAAAAILAEAILNDRKRLFPCSTLLTGQYGLDDVYIGVPVVLGAGGVERVIELELTDAEFSSLQGSGTFYKEQLSELLGY